MQIIDRLDDYQRAAARTLIDKPDSTYSNEQLALAWLALQLSVAAGAIVDQIKKGVFHQHGVDERLLSLNMSSLIGLARAMQDMQIGITPDLPDAELTPERIMRLWVVLGLVGEAGEVAALVEQQIVEPEADLRDKLVYELGDSLWYLAGSATQHGMKLSALASLNNDKLLKRYKGEGYTSAESINRDEQKA